MNIIYCILIVVGVILAIIDKLRNEKMGIFGILAALCFVAAITLVALKFTIKEKTAMQDPSVEWYLDGEKVDKTKVDLSLYHYHFDEENNIVYLTTK